MEVTQTYVTMVERFRHRLEKHQAATVLATKANVKSVTVAVESGRKYDKMILVVVTQGPKRAYTDTTLLYFVNRDSGRIFGVKSPVAPNEKRYFGKVENAKRWDWKGIAGEPVRDATVAKVGEYGGYSHYVDVVGAENAPESVEEADAVPA